jgi:hypothetical protein
MKKQWTALRRQVRRRQRSGARASLPLTAAPQMDAIEHSTQAGRDLRQERADVAQHAADLEAAAVELLLRPVWAAMDADGDGTISVEEVVQAARHDPIVAELLAMPHVLGVDWTELLGPEKGKGSKAEGGMIKMVFRHIDTDGDGACRAPASQPIISFATMTARGRPGSVSHRRCLLRGVFQRRARHSRPPPGATRPAGRGGASASSDRGWA